MKRIVAAFLLMLLCAITAQAQLSVYSGQALHNQNVSGGIVVSAPIPNGQVRVCTTPVSGMTPCANPASIFDINGNPIGVPTGFFGQLATSVTGFFSFQCSSGVYEIQIAPSTSNTPALDYLAACPLTTGGAGVTGTGLTVLQTGPTINNPILNSPSFVGVTTFTNPTINGATLSGTFSGNPNFTGNPSFTGNITVSNINNVVSVDGSTYALTGAGFQLAVAACVANPQCSDIDARQLGAVTTTTTTSLTKPIRLWLGANTVISGTSDPVLCYGSATEIDGVSGEGILGTVSAIKSTVAASRVLAPCTPSGKTSFFNLRGVDLWNSNAASTAVVWDMTNVNNSACDKSFIQQSAGTGDLVFITITGSNTAYFNDFIGCKFFANGGVAFHFTNGANAQDVIGGEINGATDCVLVDGSVTQTNGITFNGTDCDVQTLAVIHTIGSVIGVSWNGGRWESSGGSATLFNVSSSSSQVIVSGVSEFGTQGCGTTNGFVTIVSAPLGFPCANNNDIYSAGKIGSQGLNIYGATSGSFALTATATGGTLNLGSNATLTAAGALTVVSCTGCGGGGSTAFSAITAGTNTTAAMLVGSGGTLGVTGSGTIDATTLGGANFVAPGAIGSTTPGTGAFTTLSSTGVLSNSANGALSTGAGPAVSITGTAITGGSGTTTVPQVYLNAGSAPSTWTTSGTKLGINAETGFGGFFIDFHINGGSSLFNVSNLGSVTIPTGSLFAQAGTIGAAKYQNATNSHLLFSSTAPTVSSGFGTSPAITANGTGAFVINVGTGGTATGGVFTMPTAATGWICSVNDVTARATGTALTQTYQTASSTTSVTVTNQTISTGVAAAWTASDVVQMLCEAY